MLIVSNAQNLISQMTPRWFKALSPLMKTVVCVGGGALAALAAVWVYRLRAAPSLFDRVKNDAEQFRRISLLMDGEYLQVNIQRQEVVPGAGANPPSAEAIGWLKSFAGEMEVHLGLFKKELLATTKLQSKEEGMKLADSLHASLEKARDSLKRLQNSNDSQALLDSIQKSLNETEALLLEVGKQIQWDAATNFLVEKHGPGTAAALLKGNAIHVVKGDRIPTQFVADWGSFAIVLDDKQLNGTLNEDYNAIADFIKNTKGATHLCKLLVNSHFDNCHAKAAAEYFGSKGLKFEPVGKHVAKIQLQGWYVKLQLVETYRATSETAKPGIAILNPPALLVVKSIRIHEGDLNREVCCTRDLEIQEDIYPAVNLQVALKRWSL